MPGKHDLGVRPMQPGVNNLGPDLGSDSGYPTCTFAETRVDY